MSHNPTEDKDVMEVEIVMESLAIDDDVEESLEDLVSDALPPVVDDRALPLDLNKLFPWHRPRKQKVREHQWVRLTKSYITRMKERGDLLPIQVVGSDGRTIHQAPELRYLTLPGLDYLDVRMLGEAANGDGCRLTAVGFLDGASQTRVLARARVREVGLVQSGYITDQSITLPRQLESVCSADGDSLRELKRRAPFHIINIDACGSIAPKSAEHSSRLIEAIYRLVELQLAKANHRWLFFLTVDVREEDIDAQTFDALCDAIRQNAAQSEKFKSAAIELFSANDTDLEISIAKARASGGRGVLDLFSLGFSKWLLHLAEGKQWTVRLKHSHCYSTWGGQAVPPSMCSLAFEFIPPPPGLTDPLGVSRQAPAAGGPEGDPSMQIVAAAAAIDDLDVLFAEDIDLADEMNEKTRLLLIEAGYLPAALEPLVTSIGANDALIVRRFPDMAVEP